MSSAKWSPSCLGLNVLSRWRGKPPYATRNFTYLVRRPWWVDNAADNELVILQDKKLFWQTISHLNEKRSVEWQNVWNKESL